MDKEKNSCFQASLSELEKAKKILEGIKELSIDFNKSIIPILGDLSKQDLLDEVEAYELAISAIETIQELKADTVINSIEEYTQISFEDMRKTGYFYDGPQ